MYAATAKINVSSAAQFWIVMKFPTAAEIGFF